jgi:hypothetical protein
MDAANLDLSSVPFTRENAFIVYGFESNGSDDPAEIAQAALENGKLLKCPVLAQDASMAVALFSERYPDLVPSGVVSLSQLQEEAASLETFFVEQARLAIDRQEQHS